MKITKEERLLFLISIIYPSSEQIALIDKLVLSISDWKSLIDKMIQLGLAPLFYVKLSILRNNYLIPVELKLRLKQVYYKTLSRGTIMFNHFEKILFELQKNQIQIIALKGIYLSEHLYKNIALRQFSDIDLLVKPEDSIKVLNILDNLGYYNYQNFEDLPNIVSNKNHFQPRIKDNVSIEIHVKLEHKMNIEYVFENKQFISIKNMNFFVLDFHDNLIHLCLHLDKHFKYGKVQFTSYVDITNILSIYANQIDWYLFEKRCYYYNCYELVLKYLLLISKYFVINLPVSITSKNSHLLTKIDESLFLNFLRDYVPFHTAIPSHFTNVKEYKSFYLKSKYIIKYLLPSKDFMIRKYNITNINYVYIYYLYRWLFAILAIFILIFKNRDYHFMYKKKRG